MRTDLSLPPSVIPHVLLLNHHILGFVLKDHIKTTRVQIIKLLQCSRHKIVPLSIKLFNFELVFQLFKGGVGLTPGHLALFIQIGDAFAHFTLPLDHFLTYPSRLKVLAFDKLPNDVFVLVGDQPHHLDWPTHRQFRIGPQSLITFPGLFKWLLEGHLADVGQKAGIFILLLVRRGWFRRCVGCFVMIASRYVMELGSFLFYSGDHGTVLDTFALFLEN